jgi:hypothetical protein
MVTAPFLFSLLADGHPSAALAAEAVPPMVLAKNLNYEFLYPSGWVEAPKLLKTHLEEYNVKSQEKRGFYAGVAVDPVKLSSLESFGTPQFVGDRVVSVERKKDGVASAELVSAEEKTEDGIVYYDIVYVNESSHGNNHYASRIAIRDGKLVVFTVQCRVEDFDGLAGGMLAMVNSFRLR